MSVRIVSHVYQFKCDRCGTTRQWFGKNLADAWQKARRADWRIKNGHTYCGGWCAGIVVMI